MAALGDEFRSAREARGLTLSDVAERLHIRDVYLAAIENEQWDAIGAAVYVRGFLRTYARFLGLDPEDAVARFTAAAPAGPPARSVDVTKGGRAAAAGATPGEQRGPSAPALFAMLVAVALIAFAGYEYYRYRAEPPRKAPQAAAPATASATAEATAVAAAPASGASAERSAAGSPGASPAATAASSAGVKRGLTLRLVQPSWLRVTVDGAVREEGTFPAGTTRTFVGKTVTLRVGNAGGVTVSLDGSQPALLGGAGDVVERQYTLSGG